jgi:hypothetical protein
MFRGQLPSMEQPAPQSTQETMFPFLLIEIAKALLRRYMKVSYHEGKANSKKITRPELRPKQTTPPWTALQVGR